MPITERTPMVVNPTRQGRVLLVLAAIVLLAVSVHAQSELNLSGTIDTRVHSGPDSVRRSIDADDLAQLAKKQGMRGLVLKNHWEPTASLAYMVHKQVPGLEVYGGIVLDQSVGGINLEAVKRMAMMKGGFGRVVWLPTFDSEAAVKTLTAKGLPISRTEGSSLPVVPVSASGHLLPSVLELIDYMAKHPELVLETGHVSAEEVLMVVREAHRRGVKHIVVTGANDMVVNLSIAQMQEAAREGAFLEFAYSNAVGVEKQHTMQEFAEAIRKVAPETKPTSSTFLVVAWQTY